MEKIVIFGVEDFAQLAHFYLKRRPLQNSGIYCTRRIYQV